MEIGPALPPHLEKKINSSGKETSVKIEEKRNGGEERNQAKEKCDSVEEESYGPVLPPGFQKKKETTSVARIIGPMRPQFCANYPPTVESNGLYGI